MHILFLSFFYSLAFLFVAENLDGPNLSTNGRYDSSLGKVEVNKYLMKSSRIHWIWPLRFENLYILIGRLLDEKIYQVSSGG